MTISTVKYHETIFEHPNLTKIVGVPTYGTLNIPHNDIKYNSISVHSNIGGVQHGYLSLVVRSTAYVILPNTPFFCPIHPGSLLIPIVENCHTKDDQYDKNI